MTTTFHTETIQTVKDNFHLVEEHWAEVVVDKKRTLDPYWEFFDHAEKVGHLRVFVARRDGAVLGYAVFILQPHFHDKTMLTAHNDAVFLRKECRAGGVGVRLLKYCDTQLKDIHMVFWHIKPHVDFSPALKSLGYGLHETIYTKLNS